MEEILRDLQRISRRAAEVGQLFADMQRAAPAYSEGSDRSGTVTAALGPDGLPETIRVHHDWRANIPAERFAAAVTEACASAWRQRAVVWSEALVRLDCQQRLDRLDRLDRDSQPAEPEPGLDPPALGRPSGGAGSLPLDELAESAIRALDAALSTVARVRQTPPRGNGANRERTLAISLAPGGQVSCQADPRWVGQQTAAALDQAVSQALAAARQDLADSTGAAFPMPPYR
jgi:hypothetical protein